ncbi:MAG: DUF1592 domain-containing protein [Planctomycetota bacterium]|nr:DUF1592 domain-containing protein [Planctomycetota bacterium]
MSRKLLTFSACIVLALLAVSDAAEIPSASKEQETKLNKDALAPFLQRHCVRCHGPKEQNGSARFDTLDYAISDKIEALHYQDVLDVLNGGDMPPEDEPQPSNAELEVAIGELTESLFEARKRLASNGGKVVMRRLNRREYAATIRHLFGFEPPRQRIPPDDDVVNFDTVGSRQFFTTAHFDEYYGLAQEVLREGFKWAGVREAVQTRMEQPENFWTGRYRQDLESWKGQTGKVVRLSKMREEYLARPMVESGVYLDEPLRHLSFGPAVDPRGSYRIRVTAGVEGKVAPFRRFIRLNIGQDVLAVLHIDGTSQKPTESVVEIPNPALLGRRLGGYVSEDRTGAWLSHYLGFLEQTGEIEKGGAKNQGLIWIDSFSVEGPFYPEERGFFDALLCPVEPTPEKPSKIVWNDANARELIERFTFEAFRRRKPAPEYIDGLAAYFQKQREKGSPFDTAMIDTLAVVLSSPSFVYINEEADVKPESRLLSPHDSAIRLAYFLTSAPPDEELYQAVKAGSMTDRTAYHTQVDRLLTGAERHRFAEALAGQWADFTRLDAISVSDKKYPTYTSGLRHSMKQEVIAFFDTLIEQNLPVSNLIKSDFATVNAQLAVHYGIPGVSTNEFKPVKLPPDSTRGGYLTQGAFLVAGSNGERTSPTVRGMLLMSRFLNSPPAPPPPNVPELGSDVEGPTTNGKLVELHQTRAQCASCHRKMDTIGLALENFDLLGRYREHEQVWRDKIPVKISGSMPGGQAFNSFQEFQSTMLEHEEDLARNIIESLLVYALGRDIEFTDEPYIEKIMTKLRPDRFRMKDMVHAVAESPLFFQN